MKRDLKELISQMTLEEKAGMCSGLDFWHLKGVERLGIPSVMVSDGPHGLRKQDEQADHLEQYFTAASATTTVREKIAYIQGAKDFLTFFKFLSK